MPIRTATADDVEAVRQVARRSWQADYPGVLTRETVEEGVEEWYAPGDLAAAVSRERTLLLVAERAGSVVGFAHAVQRAADDVGFIMRLYVDPDHRREGTGAALLDAVTEALREAGAERIDAAVLSANERGRAFYESAGFERADETETCIGGESHPECRYSLPVDALAEHA